MSNYKKFEFTSTKFKYTWKYFFYLPKFLQRVRNQKVQNLLASYLLPSLVDAFLCRNELQATVL